MSRSRTRRPAAMRGLTLIELMVAVAIVAILASLALPSYIEHVARGHRADARGQLLLAAQYMQRFYSANDTYDIDRAGVAVADAMPANLKRSPMDTSTPIYELTVADATAVGFELRMAPAATSTMANDKCGTFTIKSDGSRGVIVGGVTGSTQLRDTCWK